MNDDDIHPWNLDIWSKLVGHSDRSTHAWLFAGNAGLGKRALASRLARFYLSERAALSDRRRQRGGEMFRAGTHPDLHVLMPEELVTQALVPVSAYAARYADPPSKGAKLKSVITVDQVRLLIARLATHAHAGGMRVVMVDPADRLYPNAANALLKILEEPPGDTVFILVTEDRARLPATIRSRASRVDFRVPARSLALKWLSQRVEQSHNPATLLEWAGGAPLAAIRLLKNDYGSVRGRLADGVQALWRATSDPISVAAGWQALGVDQSLEWLHGFVADLIKVSMVPAPPELFNPDLRILLQESANRINLPRTFDLWDRIGVMRREIDGPLDDKLMLEDIIIDLYEIVPVPS